MDSHQRSLLTRKIIFQGGKKYNRRPQGGRGEKHATILILRRKRGGRWGKVRNGVNFLDSDSKYGFCTEGDQKKN